jgi:hypothetical protein
MPAEYTAPIALAALVVALLSIVLAIFVALRLRSAGKRGRPPRTGDERLDQLITEELRRADGLTAELAELAGRLAVVEGRSRRSVQRVGIVRYNPFEDTGSNQSFALAMLDGQGDGLVLSSLHSRQMTRVYLKPIVAGRSETALSEEETEALSRAGSTSHEMA